VQGEVIEYRLFHLRADVPLFTLSSLNQDWRTPHYPSIELLVFAKRIDKAHFLISLHVIQRNHNHLMHSLHNPDIATV